MRCLSYASLHLGSAPLVEMRRNRFSPQHPHRISGPITPEAAIPEAATLHGQIIRLLRILGIAAFVLLALPGVARAQWSTLTNAMPNNNPDTCLLLTDGTVMCHEYNTQHWHRLVPDPFGSYQNGTWDPSGITIADMPNGYAPLYFASAVLPDGRVVIIGGEDDPCCNMVETNIGFMYDPTTNKWSAQLKEQFGTGNVGDDPSVILQDGTMVIGNINGNTMEAFDPATLTFNKLNDTNKIDSASEEAYTILPGVQGAAFPLNGRVFAVNTSKSNSFQIYDPTGNTWSTPGTTAGLTLADDGPACPNSLELGPTVGLPNGTIIQFSGGESGKNGIYDINTGVWSENTNLDFGLDSSTGWRLSVEDGPASLLPNGGALVMASPGCNSTNKTSFNAPSHLFDWDGTTLNEVTTSGIGFANAASYDSYQGRMLLLPTGDVLVVANNQSTGSKKRTTVELYTATGGPEDAWRPVITNAPSIVGPGDTYSISGNQFNGFSQGASYGDDAQMATNYPLVRITNKATGHVFYARTHDHSRMGVEEVGSTEVVTTSFDVPASVELGASELEVVANGIPSVKFNLNVEPATSLVFAGVSATTSDFNDPALVQARLTSGGSSVAGKTVVFTLGSGIGVPTCLGVTNSTGTATCSLTPNQPAGTYTLTATFLSDSSFAGSSASLVFVVTLEDTAVAYTGPTSGDYHDVATVKAVLTDPTDGVPIQAKTVEFVLGSGTGTETCQAMTGPSGLAMCQITPNQQAGPYTLTATFAGNAFYAGSSKSTTFTITKEETTLSYTGDVVFTNGKPANMSGVLLEDNVTPIAGRSVKFVIGSGITSQTCTATTNALGAATCTINPVAQPRGSGTVSDLFAGDAFYLPSNAGATSFVYGFPDAVRLSTYSNPSTVGQTVGLVAVVVPGEGLPDPPLPSTPTGTVTFYDLLTPLGTVALDANAVATLNVSFSSKGNHSITAKYGGDPIFIPSSATVIQTVQ